jgi:transposase-like protein
MRKHYTAKQRSELIELVKQGGATVSEAATRLGVTPSSAYSWMKAASVSVLGQAAPIPRKTPRVTAPAFARVVASQAVGAGVVVRVGAIEIQVCRDFDADLLCAVVGTLRGIEA